MFIYKITNLVTNEVYIGQTTRTVQKRFLQHLNNARNHRKESKLTRAIREYGEDNFVYDVLDTAESQEELNQKEKYWIIQYDAVNTGYNSTYKTDCAGSIYNSKTKKEKKEIHDKISKPKQGKNNPHAHSIKCRNEDTKEELYFDTVEDCRKYFKEHTHRFITTRVRHQVKSLYRGKWNISYENEDYTVCSRIVTRKNRKFEVIDLSTNNLYLFSSMTKASITLSISKYTIEKYLRLNVSEFYIDTYKFIIL